MDDRHARAATAVERACSEAANVSDLCRRLRHAIEPVVASDRWCGFAVDPAVLIATNGYHDEGIDLDLLPRLLELEYGSEDVNHLPALSRTATGVRTIAQATGGDPARSARWREVIAPAGLTHELRAVFRDRRNIWGALILLRAPDRDDFSPGEIDFIGRVAPAVGRGFRRALVRQHLDHADDVREAGILVLGGADLEIRTATPAARVWLDELADGSTAGALPYAVSGVARAARHSDRVPAVRALTRRGRWLTVTAQTTDSRSCELPDVGVILQPSRPAEIAQIVAATNGLTPRETDIVLLVASGRTNAEIARQLGLSRHTVVDHLKRTFAKLDVSTRGEVTSKLFFDHYLEPAAVDRAAGSDGWFLAARR